MVSIAVDKHIVLRSYQPEDAAALFAVIDSSRKHLHPWLNWVDKTLKPEHSLQFIQRSLDEQRAQQAIALGIFYKDEIIGGIGMHQWDQATRRAQVGYWISKDFEGRGIVHTSLSAFLDFLFNKIGLSKAELHFFSGNIRSANVASRAGFKIEGVVRQSMLRHGMPEDVVIAGLLKNEWWQIGKTPVI